MDAIATKQIPKVPGFPIIGNTKQLLNDPLELCVQSYKKYGPVFRIRSLFDDIVVLAGLEANQFLDQRGDEFLTAEEVWGAYSVELNATNNMIAMRGADHLKMRKITKRGYSPVMFIGKEKASLDALDESFDKLCEVPSLKVLEAVQNMTIDLLGLILANHKPTGYEKDIKYFLKVVLNVTVIRMWPKLYLKHPRYLKAKKRIDELAKKVLAYNKTHEHDQPNLVDDIIAAIENKEIELTDADVSLMMLTPYTAGIDTVANNVTIMIYKLMTMPELKAKARAEADDFFKDGSFDTKNLRKLDIMMRITMETMRRYPIAPVVPRTAVDDFEYEGYTIKKGQLVYMAQGVAHFDESVFKDPYQFDIDRYLPERAEHKTKSAWSPFSLGDHKCLGNRLGEVMVCLITSYMLHQLEFEAVPKDYQLKFTVLPTPGPDHGFKAKFWKREK